MSFTTITDVSMPAIGYVHARAAASEYETPHAVAYQLIVRHTDIYI
jgi:hypothetical protein